MSNPPPMGWYPDPSDPETQYFWDGTAWTAERTGAPPLAERDTGPAGDTARDQPRRQVQIRSPLAFLLLIAVLGAVGLVAIGFGPGDTALLSPDPRPVPADDGSPDPTAAPTRCRPASETLLTAVEAMGVDGLEVDLATGSAVQSLDHQRIWFLAAQVDVSGAESGVGLWAVRDRDGRGPIFSVNQLADDVTDWPLGTSQTPPVTAGDDGAAEALECAGS